MKLCAYTDHRGQCRAAASFFPSHPEAHGRGYCPSHRGAALDPAPMAVASYDGPTASGRTHLVRFADGLARTACGDGWAASHATPHGLPAHLTCSTCRRALNLPRVPVRDGDHLRKLTGIGATVLAPTGEVAS